jgi:hypothetical protein
VREKEKKKRDIERERERLVNIIKVCYERDTFHVARQPDLKMIVIIIVIIIK